MRRTIITLGMLLCFCCTRAQESAPMQYEVLKGMPAFYEELKATLTYPMAWGNSPTRRFRKWQREGRAKVLECMSPAPPKADSFAPEVLDEEQREGYKAQKIVFKPICSSPMVRGLSLLCLPCTTTVPISALARRRWCARSGSLMR